ATGEVIRRFQHPDSVYDVAFSHDGRYIATAGWDGLARLWDVNTGQEIRQFSRHTRPEVNAIAFSSDDRYLLTGGTDGTVRLWDVATGANLRVYYGNGGVILGVQFSPDDQYVVAGSADGGTRIWPRDWQPLVQYVCSHLTQDFNLMFRRTYAIPDLDPTCPS